MPPKKVSLAPNPPSHTSQHIPFQYTSFFSVAPLNAKNVSSSYLKTESQTWISRSQAAVAASQPPTLGLKKRKHYAEDNPGADASMIDEEEDLDADEEQTEALENTPAYRTIVIQPGSENIRIGRATDLFPITIPNAVARRAKYGASSSKRMPEGDVEMSTDSDTEELVRPARKTARASDEESDSSSKARLDEGVETIRNDLRAIMRQEKLRSVGNAKNLASNYNDSSQPEDVPEHNDDFGLQWTEEDTGGKNDILFGHQALRLSCFSEPKTKEPNVQQRRKQQMSGAKPLSPPDAQRPWTLFRPFQRGTLDVNAYQQHYGASGAVRALLNDISCLFEHAITSPPENADEREDTAKVASHGLGIPREDLSSYSVILIIPDLFSRADVKALTDVLLVDMGFVQTCIQQESVCATFGAGLSSGCVVDLGAEYISISCVEEGLILPETRIHLSYAGNDLTRFLAELFIRAKFPYRQLDYVGNMADFQLMDELKRKLVTLNPADVGLNIHDFYLRLPSRPTTKYLFRTYDELIMGPMSLFDPSVFDLDRKAMLKGKFRAGHHQDSGMDNVVAEDAPELGPFHALDIAVTGAMTSCVKHLLPPPAAPTVSAATAAPTGASTGAAGSETGTPVPTAGTDKSKVGLDNDSAVASRATTPLATSLTGTGSTMAVAEGSSLPSAAASARPSPAPHATTQAGTTTTTNGEPPAPNEPTRPTIDIAYEASKTPLDTAVLNSLLASIGQVGPAGDERLRKMSNNIVCVGGTAFIPGLAAALQARLVSLLNMHFHSTTGDANNAPKVTVIPPPRDMDPQVLAWKGMSVFARLEAATQELCLRKEDWTLFGYRALKEKTLFL